MYLQIYKENRKTPHRWKVIARKISESQKIDNIIVKNKELEIQRKIKDFKKHQSIIKQIPFELSDIIEYLNESEDKSLKENEEEVEREEEEEEEENTTDDETMNPY